MGTVRVGVAGDGALGRRVVDRLPAHGAEVGSPSAADVVIRATPADAWADPVVAPSVVPAVRQRDVEVGDLAVAGFWGGLGSLLAAVAVAEAEAPRAVHVAYGLPGARRVLRRSTPTVRRALVGLATDDATAVVDGEAQEEPLGEGRRLAWFPKPVGPAHAVAVGGLEQAADLGVPTVRTWLAARSMTAELLQGVGRLDPATGVGAWLDRRAASGGAGELDDVRWAVVAECLDADGTVVRSWANGTDPLLAAADLLIGGAQRLATVGAPSDRSLAGFGDAVTQLDALADLRTLRWAVSRPEPSPR